MVAAGGRIIMRKKIFCGKKYSWADATVSPMKMRRPRSAKHPQLVDLLVIQSFLSNPIRLLWVRIERKALDEKALDEKVLDEKTPPSDGRAEDKKTFFGRSS